MNPGTDIQGAMAMAQSAPVQAPRSTSDTASAKKAAQQFEGVLISQMMNDMFSGIKTDGMFGGGPGEDMFRSMMVDEYAKQVSAQGGLGLADSVTRELLKRQEGLQ